MSASPREILERSQTVAVVGLSRHPHKAAYAIPRSLQSCGFRIIPVHPQADEVLGERAYPRLEDIPEHVDLVDVFRPSSEAPAIARATVAIGADALWLQLGIRSDDARRIAEEAGIDYVEDECTGALASMYGIRKRSD